MDPEVDWRPANGVEQRLAESLRDGDGATFAQLLRSSRLFIPALPAPGSPAAEQLATLLPPDADYVPVFTSLESLVWTTGDLVSGYEEIDFATLLQRWPGDDYHLALNLGSPIATYTPLTTLDDLAAGRQRLLPLDEVRREMSDEARRQIRQRCLRELAGSAPDQSGDPPTDPAAGLRGSQPSNALEEKLQAAVAGSDGEAFLHALMSGEENLLLLTAAPVADPGQIFDPDFPWRVLGGDQAQVIPVFSSTTLLEDAGAGDSPHIRVDFLHVLANWPGEDRVLAVNLGSAWELLLPGELVLEVIGSMAEAADLG